MKKIMKLTASLILVMSLASGTGMQVCASETLENPSSEKGLYAPDEILVLYDKEFSKSKLSRAIEESEIQVLSESDEQEIALVEIPDDMSVEQAVKQYEKEDGVIAAAPNYILTLYGDAVSTNDPYVSRQSYMDQVFAAEAWSYCRNMPRTKVRVAVLDTGADISHPDLKNVLNAEISREILDDSGTLGPLKGDGYIEGVYSGSGNGHGTHICGIIAAQADNMEGIAGVGTCGDNSTIELMAVDIFSSDRTTKLSYLIYGMDYAAEQGAKIINLSLGVEKASLASALDDRIMQAKCEWLASQGITMVCAAGNDGRYDNGIVTDIPSDYYCTVSVMAVDERGARASYSNYGSKKDVSAPGNQLYSTYPGGIYRAMTGTSMATPVVTAVVGMMYALNPYIKPAEVKRILMDTAQNSPMRIIDSEKAVMAASMPFKDLSVKGWYYKNVGYVYSRNVMTGLNEEEFGSDSMLARAQFAKMLYRMNGAPEVEYKEQFPDIEEGKWYTDAVLWASGTGVVEGYTDTGMFGPSDYITREQMAVMMYRYAQYKGYETDEEADFTLFTDASFVSPYAREAMRWAVGSGIITGKGNGTKLDPGGYAVRAECAAIMERFMKRYE